MTATRSLPTWLFWLLLGISFFFATTLLRSNEIQFSSDIARDFHLLREVDEKKLILIGPRSSVGGLFHGPLWIYLNYPAYVLGGGNPIVVGWFWILLATVFTWSCYRIAKSLISELVGQLTALMISLYMVYIANGFFNPHGAMFVIPFFFYTAVKYAQSRKVSYILLHVFAVGVIIQFQMAIGVPLLMLTLVYHAYLCWKHKSVKHLLSFGLLVIPLSTFLLFDARHDHILLKNAIRHIQSGNHAISFGSLVWDRVYSLITGIEFLRSGGSLGNGIVFFTLMVCIYMEIRKRHHTLVYGTFLYFLVGFYAVSLINAYPLLYFYTFPIFPLAFIVFTSVSASTFRYVGITGFFIVYALNLVGISQHLSIHMGAIRVEEASWQTQWEVAKSLYAQNDTEFGYFVYSPDTLAYGSKYAIFYHSRLSPKIAHSFKKMPVTYLIIAPPPKNNPLMSDAWWKEHKLHLTKMPDKTISFPSGYKIERYTLTKEEIAVPFDPQIDPGIFFR
jgi:hypothetical protein